MCNTKIKPISFILIIVIMVGMLYSVTIDASAAVGDIFVENGLKYEVLNYTPGQSFNGNYVGSVRVLKPDTKPTGSVIIPDLVTNTSNGETFAIHSIEARAFEDCTGITSFQITLGLKFIGEYALKGCSGISTLRIPAHTDAIYEGAFADCNLQTVNFGCAVPPGMSGKPFNQANPIAFGSTNGSAKDDVFIAKLREFSGAPVGSTYKGTQLFEQTPTTSSSNATSSGDSSFIIPYNNQITGSNNMYDYYSDSTTYSNPTLEDFKYNSYLPGKTESVTSSNNVYPCTAGFNQEYTAQSDGLKFTFDAPYKNFVSVYVDGTALTQEQFQSYEGSTIIVLNTSFLNQLNNGTHNISIQFTDGTAQSSFHVNKSVAVQTQSQNKTVNPSTGQNQQTNLNIIFAIAIVIVLTLIIIKFRRII